MLMVMEMSTGKIVKQEFGAIEDVVANAEWLPPAAALPMLQLGLQEVRPHADRRVAGGEAGAEACVRQMCLAQQ